MDNRFVNLHGHSEYSSLDGFCKISSLVSRVQAIGQQAIALTDHGNLNGAYKFYKECTKQKIKPILGNEMYLTRTYEKGGQKYYHATILAQNNTGWSNLLKLHKLSYINRYYKPRVDFNDLFAHKEGLIVLSGCPSGVLSSHIRDNDLKSAESNLLLFKEQFGDNFYIEIMDHSLEFQKNINKALRELSAKYSIKKVATVDYHYPEKSDALYQDYLVCDQLKTDINDTTRKMKLEPSEFYIKRREEVNATEDELDNTLEIADKCSVKIQSTGWLLPHIENEQELLVQYIEEGFIKRNIPRNDIYLSRLREEYKTVIEANLIGYLLTVRDYINFARENDILVGPGRGSVGGCLIAYLIGIHDVNPIKHNLLFSRFYNAGRSHSLPDIDIDFPEKDIQTVRDYIHNKYGKEYVAHIGTSTVLQPKGAVKLLCRVLGIEFKQSNIYSETVEDTNASLKLAARDSVYADIIEKAKHFEGLSVYSSIHAAGMIISPEKLENLIPLRVNEENDLYVSGWDMKDVESIGLVKFDFLSLNTLDVIKDTLKSINLKIEDIPTDDQKAFELINTTNNVGIFQLSSDGISKLANDAKVQSIDDIAAVVALYRPGPMGSNFHIKYVNRKHGKEPVTYLHPKLEPVLKNTYGLLIFQEQTTQIAMALAGFTEREADNLRKAVGKKIVDLMQEQKELFLKGCEKNDIPKAIASEIWHEIEMFAGYGFNLCIDGDCYITRDNKYGTQYTIAEMYDLKNNPKKYLHTKQEHISGKYRSYGYGKARNLIDGRIFKDTIKDIYYQGKKPVYKITLENGKSISCTGNHKFPTTDGIKIAQDLRVGEDSLYCMGSYEENVQTYPLSLSKQDCKGKTYKSHKGFPKGEDNPGYIDGSYVKYQEAVKSLEHIKKCQICDKSYDRLEHHHKDKNRNNNSIDNIAKLCPSCHKKEDYKLGRKKKFSKGVLSELSTIISIEYVGEKDVYDIEMCNEPHNLLVNEIATCNSHSVEYGYITYYTAYLKAHYPLHFMASLLNNNYNKADKLRLYLTECYKMGIKVNPPSVKNGNYDFRVYQNEIIFGLKGVNGIGEKTAKSIYSCAFENFEDFCIKIKPSKDLIIILAEAGALDDFGYTRNTFIESAPEIVDKLKGRKVNPKTRSLFETKTNIFIKELSELEDNVLANKEYSRLNTYLRYDPLKNVELAVPESLNGLIFIEGFISKFESKITKKKSTIGIIKLATKLGPIEVIIFPKLYVEIKEKIKENMYIAVEGNYEDKLLARKIWPRYE